MTTLTRCPLCGADSGYSRHDCGVWWSIHCPACGERVSECRSGYVDPPEGRTKDADEAWNEAGKYAQGLRDRVARLEEVRSEATFLVNAIRAFGRATDDPYIEKRASILEAVIGKTTTPPPGASES